MNEQQILNLFTQAGAPLTIALVALYLLRDEGRRNAAALRQVIDEYRQSIQALTEAIHQLMEAKHG